MEFSDKLPQKFAAIWSLLDERTRRIMSANEAMILGYGGISAVSKASGLSRKAIAHGVQDIKNVFALRKDVSGVLVLGEKQLQQAIQSFWMY